jgi:hypothetical protein
MDPDAGKLRFAVVGAGAAAMMAVSALGVALVVTVFLGRREVQEAAEGVTRAEAALRVALDELTELGPAVVARTQGSAADVAALAAMARREQRLPEKLAHAERLRAALAEAMQADTDPELTRKLGLVDRRIGLERAAVEDARAAVEVAASRGAGRVADALGLAR